MKITDEELIDELKQRIDNHKRNINVLEDLTQQLTKVNEKLNKSEELKSHFITNITNELIAPFASALALSHEAMICGNKNNFDEMKNIISMINTEMFYLNLQLRNISAAAKLEAGEFDTEISSVNINNLINNMIELFQNEADKKNISVNFEPLSNDEMFTTDAILLKTILSNLISNALKFNKPNGDIQISAKRENKQLSISIKDSGIGIADNFKDEIFDRFTKAKDVKSRGQGLGLSIVRALLELIEGNIYFDSTLNVGSRFTITIPENTTVSNSLSDDRYFSIDEGTIF